MHTYLFYDIETTGLNFPFDQVLQFGSIRTDMEFNEIDRREIMVKLRPDIIPSPGAMLAHCIPLSRTESGISEFEATQQIHTLLNEPNTISLGYNTLRFDDEFLRFAFHRNLLPPYRHQFAHNCSRLDLLPMVTFYWLYKNDVLEWPEIEDRVSLKLEHLLETNRLTTGTPHDAMTDVTACVELARRLAHEKETWDYLTGYFNKEEDRRRMLKLTPFSDRLPEAYKLGLLVSPGIGWQRNYQAPALYLGDSKVYPDRSLWLRLDMPHLRETEPDSITKNTWVVRKKYGEPGFILPAYDRFLSRVDEERSQILLENKRWLEANPDLLERITAFHREYAYPYREGVDADAMLYQMDFLSRNDEDVCRRFHDAALHEKIEIADSFESPVAKELAQRILLRNFAQELPGAVKPRQMSFMQRVAPTFEDKAILGYTGKTRRTPKLALAEINNLREERELSPSHTEILDELESYIYGQFIAGAAIESRTPAWTRDFEIFSGSFYLRPLLESDAHAIHSIWTNQHVRRYLFDDVVIPVATAKEEIEKSQNLFREKGCGLWAVFRKSDPRMIGFTGFRTFHEPGELQLLYGLLPEYCGKGYATGLAKLMIKYGFEEVDFCEISASAGVPNPASIRVMEKAGMSFEKQVIINGLKTVYYKIQPSGFDAGEVKLTLVKSLMKLL